MQIYLSYTNSVDTEDCDHIWNVLSTGFTKLTFVGICKVTCLWLFGLQLNLIPAGYFLLSSIVIWLLDIWNVSFLVNIPRRFLRILNYNVRSIHQASFHPGFAYVVNISFRFDIRVLSSMSQIFVWNYMVIGNFMAVWANQLTSKIRFILLWLGSMSYMQPMYAAASQYHFASNSSLTPGAARK